MLFRARSDGPEEKGKARESKMSETQRAVMESKLMQLHQTCLDLQAKMAQEKRERDQDFDQVRTISIILTTIGLIQQTLSILLYREDFSDAGLIS